jgi:hypothetical protein
VLQGLGRPVTALTAVVAAVVLSGCSGADPTEPAAAPASSPKVDSGSPGERPKAPSEAPEPHEELSPPATTSGPLSQDSFPTPADLGRGWQYAVDAGDAEEGYLGNGTPALERDPAEVVLAAVPIGCPRTHALPQPGHALEVDYTYEGVKVVSVRSSFANASSARSFFDARRSMIQDCKGTSGGQAIGPLVTRLSTAAPGVLTSDRTPASDPWSELAVLDGDAVVLVAAQTVADTPPLTGAQVRRLAKTFRS